MTNSISVRNTDQPQNTDQEEINKFSAMASGWWDPEGDLKTLHNINPVRLDYIDQHA